MCKPPYINVHEYHQRKEESKKERRGTEPSSSSKPEVAKSRSRIAAETYQNLRIAHKQSEKDAARNLRKAERERLANIQRMEDDNIRKYREAFKERNPGSKKPPKDEAKPDEPSVTPQTDTSEAGEEECYTRLDAALETLELSRAARIRELISYPDKRWTGFLGQVSPTSGWQLAVVPPKDENEDETK